MNTHRIAFNDGRRTAAAVRAVGLALATAVATSGGACSSSGSSSGTFTLTSPAFAEGQTIPTDNTCAGTNVSPELDWTAGPTATKSYALIVTDLTAAAMYVHWVVWDMPPDTRTLRGALPADAMLTTPANAKQVHLDLAGAGNGYVGPCPSGALHTYQFEINALDVDPVPNALTTWASADVKTEVLMHTIAHADLTGTSNATMLATDGGGQ